jgi:hypothetical protein
MPLSSPKGIRDTSPSSWTDSHRSLSSGDNPQQSQDNVAVLLVAKDASTSDELRDYLKNWGCDVSSVGSLNGALGMLQSRPFDAVLCELLLPDGTSYGLIPHLRKTNTTMFFSCDSADGCWWTNAVYEGQVRSREPERRCAQFRDQLDRILVAKLFAKPKKMDPGGPANHRGALPSSGQNTEPRRK